MKQKNVVCFFPQMFYIERELKDLAPEERKTKREEKENTVWEEFWNWLPSLQPAGGSKLEKAVNYAQNHRETLCNYLLDGRCEISNNAAERRQKAMPSEERRFYSIHLLQAHRPAL